MASSNVIKSFEKKNDARGKAPGGYDKEFVGPIRDEDRCSLCKLVMKRAVQLSSCGHYFCRDCIKPFMHDSHNKCPKCGTTLRHASMQFNTNQDRAIQELMVYCDNRRLGCEETSLLKNCKAHAKKCLYERQTCEHCDEADIPRENISHHHQSVCEEFPTYCCFKEFGCNVEMRRKEISVHEASCVRSHVTFLMMSFNQLKKESTATQQQLKLQLNTYKDELHGIKVELKETQDKMEKTQDELKETQKELKKTEAKYNESVDKLTSSEVNFSAINNQLKEELSTMQDKLSETGDELSSSLVQFHDIKEKLKEEFKKDREEIRASQETFAEIKEDLLNKFAENKKLTEELKEQLEKSVEKIDKNVEKNKQELESRITELREEMKTYHPMLIWRVEMTKRMKDKVSPYFYTKKYGYKLYVRAWWYVGDVYWFDCRLTKGENDKDLRWPMEGNISLTVRDATSGKLLSSKSDIFSSARQRPETDGDDHLLLRTGFLPPSSPLKVEVCVE